MSNISKSLILGFVLALLCLPPLHAQTPGSMPTDNKSKAADAPTSGQAPDEVMKKLSDLVHAGKYSGAQQLTAGMLLAFPDDQRLIKAKALLDKSLANAAATTTTPGSNQAVTNETSTQPAANEKGGLLTGMDKVDYNALIVLARQAQENTDLEQQKASLKQFMNQSSPFLQKHPNEMLLWQLRAASAISLDDAIAGYEAGQKLLAAGAADSDDPNLQQLLAGIKNKGWLDKQAVENAQEYIWLQSLKLSLAYGKWSPGISPRMKATMTFTVSGLAAMKQPVEVRLENASPSTCRLDGGVMGAFTIKPGDAPGGTYTTTRTASHRGMGSYNVPCTVNGSVVNKDGREISRVTVGDGY